MRLLFGIVAIFQLAFCNDFDNVKYVVFAPGTIRSSWVYSVAVSIHNMNTSCVVLASITSPYFHRLQSLHLNPQNHYKMTTFNLPEIWQGKYMLTVDIISEGKTVFKNSSILLYKVDQPIIRVQFDKGIYNPGDIVNFRVILLNEILRPAIPDVNAFIYIQDHRNNYIKDYRNISTATGVYSNNLQISKYMIAGTWKLVVQNGPHQHKVVRFTVQDYEPPNIIFSCIIPKRASILECFTPLRFEAFYVSGAPVSGKIIVLQHVQYASANFTIFHTLTLEYGKIRYMLNLMDLGQYAAVIENPPPMKVHFEFSLEEDILGRKLNRKADMIIYPYRHTVKCLNIKNLKFFRPGVPQTVFFQIRDYHGIPVKDTVTDLWILYELILESKISAMNAKPPPQFKPVELIFYSKMNIDAISQFNVTLPQLPVFEDFNSYYNISMHYWGELLDLGYATTFQPILYAPPKNFFKIVSVPNKNQTAIFMMHSGVPIKSFYFITTGKGNLLEMEYITMRKPSTQYSFNFQKTNLMAPYATVFIYYVDNNGLLWHSEVTFKSDIQLQNKITITAPEENFAGDDVPMLIETTNQSFVGLIAVEKRVWLLDNRNVLKIDDFQWILGRYRSYTPKQGSSYYPGQMSGLLTFTNAHYNFNKNNLKRIDGILYDLEDNPLNTGSSGNKKEVANAVRGSTWIFSDIESIQSDKAYWTIPIPDLVNNWTLSAFSLHSELGLAIMTAPLQLQATHDLFLSLGYPRVVAQGQEATIIVYVHNTMETDADIKVSVNHTEFLVECSGNLLRSESMFIKNINVKSRSVGKILYRMTPKYVGESILNTTAKIPNSKYGREDYFIVEPEGIKKYYNRIFFVDLRKTGNFNSNYLFRFPDSYIIGSENIMFSISTDLLGPIINNLDNFLHEPVGNCGEIISMTLINSIVYEYLSNTNKLSITLDKQITRNMEMGYQAILNFKLSDGSFTVNRTQQERAERSIGSTALTAFASFSLEHLSKHITVDAAVMDGATKFLLTKQAPNGSFVEDDLYIVARQHCVVTLTAEVLLSLQASNGRVPKTSQVKRGLDYLNHTIHNTNALLPRVIGTYAMQRFKVNSAKRLIKMLQNISNIDENFQWWHDRAYRDSENDTPCLMWWCMLFSSDRRINAYMVLALLETESSESILPIIRWLIKDLTQQPDFSYMEHVEVSLLAITKFAVMVQLEPSDAQVKIISSGCDRNKYERNFKAKNSYLFRNEKIQTGTREINFDISGSGVIIAQIYYTYTVNDTKLIEDFAIEVYVSRYRGTKNLRLEVCVTFIARDIPLPYVPILELPLPPGYLINALEIDDGDSEYDLLPYDENTILLYYKGLYLDSRFCHNVSAIYKKNIPSPPEIALTMYDYYNPKRKTRSAYKFELKPYI